MAPFDGGKYKSFASSLETPHSGYHFHPQRKGRFMEGWYFKVAIPAKNTPAKKKKKKNQSAAPDDSFAFMYSIEDPNLDSPASGLGAQVMGPQDTYMVQYSRDTRRFWGWTHKLGLGGTFRLKDQVDSSDYPTTMLTEEDFSAKVLRGFQVSSTWHQGHLSLESKGVGGYIKPGVKECSWAYSTKRVHGWGDVGGKQLATAGWLAALPVFEPHWQILMSYGLSSGWIRWGSKLYEFEDAPSYSEKNWGEGFPKRWFWIQCNSFGDEECTAVTAGGGRRTLPLLVNQDEDVALIGIHHAGKFIEIVPWNGDVSWKVSPWGSWIMKGRTKGFKVELEAKAVSTGTVLRAPTVEGLIPVCKDTFDGILTLKVWEEGKLIIERTSNSAALEVGGGPWWDSWWGNAEMKEPLRSVLQVPVDVKSTFPKRFWPSGL